jgi:hypothetical protein
MADLSGTIREVPGTARPADLAQRIAIVGHFAGLDSSIPQIITVQQSGNVKTVAGYGKGSDLAAYMLRDAEQLNANATLYLVPHPPTVPGSITFVSQVGFGPAATLAEIGDEPHDDATVKVKIAQTGGPGVGTFQVSTAYSVTRDVDGGAPQILPFYEAARVMPPRTAATITGSVDLTTLVYALPATVTGTVDLVNTTSLYGASGTLAGKDFDINIDGGGLQTVTFGSGSSAPGDYLDVLSTIDTVISGQGTVSVNGLGRLVLRGADGSTAGSSVLGAGTPEARAPRGLTAASTNGPAGALDGLDIDYQGDATAGAQTYTFPTGASAVVSAAAVVAALTALTGVDSSLYTAKNWLRVGSSTSGSASTFVINDGTALSTLGLAVGSATGSESEFVIAHLGVKITFVNGTYTVGYERTWTVKAPAPSITDVTDAIDALVAQEIRFGRVVVASELPLLDIAPTIQALDVKIGSLEAANDARFAHALVMAPLDESDTLVRTQYISAPTRRVDIACRTEYVRPAVSSPNNSGVLLRSQGWSAAAHYAAYSLGTDIGQHDVNGTPAPARYVDYVPVDEDNAVVKMALFRDDTADPRAVVFQRWADGYYFTAGYTLAVPTSAYADQYVRDIILRVAQLIHTGLRPFLNLPTLPLTSTGRLTDKGAASISASCMTMLGVLLPPPDAGGTNTVPSLLDNARVSVDQTEIIGGPGGTQRLTVDAIVQTKGVARRIRYTAGAGLIEVV